MEYAVKAETHEGKVVILRRGFASEEALRGPERRGAASDARRKCRRWGLEHISVWVNRGDSQGNLDERVFDDRFGILETIDVEALFFGPARAGGRIC